jgi:hypothetical protein
MTVARNVRLTQTQAGEAGLNTSTVTL